MGMRGLPAASAASLEDGVRGTNRPTKATAREEHSEEEEGDDEDKLSPLPSWTSSHKTSVQVCALLHKALTHHHNPLEHTDVCGL